MIYFKGAEKAKTINQLLKLGYINGQFFLPTYSDPALTLKQCHGARRSFGDLFKICRTYFPKAKEKTLAKILVKKYFSFYCKTTGLLVFMKYIKTGFEALMHKDYNEDYKDDFGLSYNGVVLKILEDK